MIMTIKAILQLSSDHPMGLSKYSLRLFENNIFFGAIRCDGISKKRSMFSDRYEIEIHRQEISDAIIYCDEYVDKTKKE